MARYSATRMGYSAALASERKKIRKGRQHAMLSEQRRPIVSSASPGSLTDPSGANTVSQVARRNSHRNAEEMLMGMANAVANSEESLFSEAAAAVIKDVESLESAVIAETGEMENFRVGGDASFQEEFKEDSEGSGAES